MNEELTILQDTALTALASATDPGALAAWKGQYLGDKGAVRGLFGNIRNVPAEQKGAHGQAINLLKTTLEAAFSAREQAVKLAARNAALADETVDVSLPGRLPSLSYSHIISQTIREVTEAFVQMGFQIYEGPQVEWDLYNFEKLNIPPEHPARSMQDTFYITEKMLLRTHTSPNQIRVMEQNAPPIRVVVPGRVYRAERTDATHEFYIYQMEALVVGEHVTMADLKGTLAAFARLVFAPDAEVKFVCNYFSYVEPGAQVVVNYTTPSGKKTGWLELLGGGMVHPDVLRNGGIDPDKYTGFAFGMGIERVAMLKYDLEDIRHIYANDLRFLEQFG